MKKREKENYSVNNNTPTVKPSYRHAKTQTCDRHRYVPFSEEDYCCFFCGKTQTEGEPYHKPGENCYAIVYRTQKAMKLLGCTHAWKWWAKNEEEIKKEWAERLPKYEIVRIIFIRKGE